MTWYTCMACGYQTNNAARATDHEDTNDPDHVMVAEED